MFFLKKGDDNIKSNANKYEINHYLSQNYICKYLRFKNIFI